MKILFVCKHNRFRSKVAEAIFKKYNKNKKIKVRSRGIIKDIPTAKTTVEVMKTRGIKLKDKTSRKVSKKDIEWSDLVVIVADNINIEAIRKLIRGSGSKKTVKRKKVEVWKISDVSQNDAGGIKVRAEKIEKRVKSLLTRFRYK